MRKTLPIDAVLVPDNAKRAFKGDIFDVYQWPQTMFDGRTKTFELLKRADTVQVLLVRDGQVLLVNDEQPGRSVRLHLPGGRVDDEDESWLQSAKRELREETGFICKNWKLVSVRQPVPKIEWFVPMYLAQDITDEVPQQLDPGGEKIELIWRDFDTLRDTVLTGTETTMSYLIPLLIQVKMIEELLALPDFKGKVVER